MRIAENDFYKYATTDLIKAIGKNEMTKIYKYAEAELDYTFIGFLYSYADLANLPKDFTIIDLGCFVACQGYYFRNHKNYIGVEPYMPIESRLELNNSIYYKMLGQQFIKQELPNLIKNGLDLNKTFCVCSYVPDTELYQYIIDTFPYHRIWYTDHSISEIYPDKFIPEHYLESNAEY